MATTPKRQKMVIANAMNMVVEINQILVENAKKRTPGEIVLPSLFDRAFMIVHETGIVPVTDTISES
jgi:hypothetical protein